jgi:hypothetical protein
MELIDISGHPRFMLFPVGYEFPDAAAGENDPFDLNWLTVRCHIDIGDRAWTKR